MTVYAVHDGKYDDVRAIFLSKNNAIQYIVEQLKEHKRSVVYKLLEEHSINYANTKEVDDFLTEIVRCRHQSYYYIVDYEVEDSDEE